MEDSCLRRRFDVRFAITLGLCLFSLLRAESLTSWDLLGGFAYAGLWWLPLAWRPRQGLMALAAMIVLRRELLVISLVPLTLQAVAWAGEGLAQGRRRFAGPVVLWLLLHMLFGVVETSLWGANQGWFDCRLYYKEKWPDGVPFGGDGILELGFCPKPNQRVRITSHFNGGALDWQALFTTDAKGRRTVINQRSDGPVLALFGCSNTFGHGLNDGDTLGSRMQAEMPGHRVINMGVNAYGPGKILLAMEGVEPTFRIEASEPVEDVVYFFIPHHFHRNAFAKSWSYLGLMGEVLFRLEGDSVSRFSRQLTSTRSTHLLANYLNQHTHVSKLVRFPKAPETDVDAMWVELTARLVHEMEQTTKERWQARFHIVLTGYLDLPRYAAEMEMFRARLAEFNIDVIDLTGLVPDYADADQMPTWFDRTTTHLTAKHVRDISAELAKRLSGRGR